MEVAFNLVILLDCNNVVFDAILDKKFFLLAFRFVVLLKSYYDSLRFGSQCTKSFFRFGTLIELIFDYINLILILRVSIESK